MTLDAQERRWAADALADLLKTRDPGISPAQRDASMREFITKFLRFARPSQVRKIAKLIVARDARKERGL